MRGVKVVLVVLMLLAMGLITGAAGSAAGSAAASASAPGGVKLSVLSNRADLVSAGDALVRVALPAGVAPSKVRVTAAGRDVTSRFAVRPNGHFEGLVTGLPLGRSVLRASAAGASDQLTVTNHRNGGPVLSGPHVQPWVCQPGAVDKLCNQPAQYSYKYKSSNPLLGGLQPYDPANPPADVATTTTDQGRTVPFVVRVETGYQDRDQYQILTLFDPAKPWRPWAPQPQWNHKVLIPHGGNCGYSHAAGEAPLDDASGTVPISVPGMGSSYVNALGRGFAVMSTALDNLGHNCNLVTAAESLMMAKERLVEQYGPIRYTIGTGCSGGSITQNTVANAYPGIYQGLITTCSYPDAVSTLAQFADLQLMRQYFEDPAKWSTPWLPTQWGPVEGHLTHLNAVVSSEAFFKPLSNPSNPCEGVSDAERYHPESNPGGVRCLLMDYMINVFGPRPESAWGPQEKEIGRGFGGIPLGNDGVAYGLKSLKDGVITPGQFVDLNTKIGGLTIDGKPSADRTTGDVSALRRAYRSGAINAANNLSSVAIINHGGPDPGLAHDYVHAFWTRARIERAQGHHGNHVMWFGEFPLLGNPNWPNEALLAMDKWLAAVEADTSGKPLADKIVDDRPADLRDRCSNLPGLELIELPLIGKVCELPLLQTKFGSPRDVAGGPVTNDVNACQLKPLLRTEFYPASFSDAQWSQLQQAFPDGVCDYSKPGVGAGDTVPWLTYQACDGDVRYGGEPLGSAPRRSGAAWTSGSFASWTDTPQARSGNLGSCGVADGPPSSGSGSGSGGSGSGGSGSGGDGSGRPAGDGGGSSTEAAQAAGSLATTGSPLALVLAAAVWLLSAGTLAVRVTRRRAAAAG